MSRLFLLSCLCSPIICQFALFWQIVLETVFHTQNTHIVSTLPTSHVAHTSVAVPHAIRCTSLDGNFQPVGICLPLFVCYFLALWAIIFFLAQPFVKTFISKECKARIVQNNIQLMLIIRVHNTSTMQ